MTKIWTLSTGSRVLPSKSSISNRRLRKTTPREKLLFCFCRGFWEAEHNRTSCTKARRRDLHWLSSCWLLPRFPTYQKTKPSKSYSKNTKKSSKTPCTKDSKARSSHKLWTNSQRSSWDTHKKNVSCKKSKRHKPSVANDRFKKLVAGMPKKLFEQESNACTRKLLRWTRVQSTATWTGSSTIQCNGRQTGRPASWLTWENRRWTSICKATRGGLTTTRPWSGIWFSRSCYQTCRGADCRRKCNWNKDGSKRQPRNPFTRHSPKPRRNSCNKSRNDHLIK